MTATRPEAGGGSDVAPPTPDDLWPLLRPRLDPEARRWLEEAVERVRRDPAALATVFPAVGRQIGRHPLPPDPPSAAPAPTATVGVAPRPGRGGAAGDADVHQWTVDDAGRAVLLVAAGERVWGELEELYRFGDAAERRGILRALHLLPPPPADRADLGERLVDDAVRTNDPRLLAAALGPYAVERLGEEAFDQAVLKCVFVGVPLAGIEGLPERATPSLARMLATYARERVAAGRDVPADVWPLIEAHPPPDELAALEAEAHHPVASRRRAAAAALAQRAAHHGGGEPPASPAQQGANGHPQPPASAQPAAHVHPPPPSRVPPTPAGS
jgi:hypothetical protein